MTERHPKINSVTGPIIRQATPGSLVLSMTGWRRRRPLRESNNSAAPSRPLAPPNPPLPPVDLVTGPPLDSFRGMRRHLPVLAPLREYQAQAAELLAGHRAADPEALGVIHQTHPRFLDSNVTWLPRPLAPTDIAAAPFDLADAKLALARGYSFLDWDALTEFVAAVTDPASPVHRFERLVEAVLDGDLATLEAMLADNPELATARSTRRTCHDPSVHRATALHYLAANGVESYRQRTAGNAVAVAQALLAAGAAVDALAGMYGGDHPTLTMLVSSQPPHQAGVQRALAETLLDHGAAVDGAGAGAWRSPLRTALVFGYADTAELLADRGATIDLVTAAGLGRVALVRQLWPAADSLQRHQAFALAALLGRLELTRDLLAEGADPNRFNPDGFHAHATPLHQAALAGNRAMVDLLLRHGARTDLTDHLYHGTPKGWAIHGGHPDLADLL